MSSIAAASPELSALIRENSELKTTNLYLQVLVEKLQYQIAQLTRRQFGVSSEHAAQIGLFLPAELAVVERTPADRHDSYPRPRTCQAGTPVLAR